MASVDGDHTHWARIGVRLTASIQNFGQSHLQFTDLTPNMPRLASTVSKYSPAVTPHPQNQQQPVTREEEGGKDKRNLKVGDAMRGE